MNFDRALYRRSTPMAEAWSESVPMASRPSEIVVCEIVDLRN